MSETERKTTTRRVMMGNAGMAALAAIAAVAITAPDAPAVAVLPTPRGDDAELVAIGRETAAVLDQRKPLDVRWWGLPPDASKRGTASNIELMAVADALEPIDNRLQQLSDRMLELRATTREAWIAKARLIRREIESCNVTEGVIDFDGMPDSERLAWSLAEDLLGAEVVR